MTGIEQAMKSETIFKQLEGIDNLPTLPAVVQELGKAIRDPNSDAKRIGGIIEDDPSIMARILKVVNSAYYGSAEPITSVQAAVARMGMRAVNNIAMSTAVFSAFDNKEKGLFNREEFWRHSISSGLAAVVVYERSQENLGSRFGKDVLHLMGLLHDIGKIIYDQFFHEQFELALRCAAEEKIPLCDAERKVIGADHAEVGAWFGMKWNLSSELLQVIRWHHEPEHTDVEDWEMVAICHTADYICNFEHIGNSGNVSPSFQQSVWKRLGLGVSDIESVVEDVKEASKDSEILMSFV